MATGYSRRHMLGMAAAVGGLSIRRLRAVAAPEPTMPDFASLTLEQQVGQMVIARFQDWPLMERYVKQGLVSGMTPSLPKNSPADVAEFTNRFQSLSPLPLLMGWGGIGYSGGTSVDLDRAMRLGATRDPQLCREAGRIEAREARAVGIHMSAPVLDVNLNPDNTIINTRALGDDAELVASLGAAIAAGVLEGGAAPVLCHFPGHGATRGDSHVEMPVARRTLAELEAVELRPFAALIAAGLARIVCTNHCHYPALDADPRPATLSQKIVTGLLREKLGYEGVIMSDSLTMRPIKVEYGIEEAAIETVRAGHDLILQDYGSDPKITIDALARAVRQGRIPREQIERSVRRVWRLKQDLGLFERRLVDPAAIEKVFDSRESGEVARRIAQESVTLLEDRLPPPPRATKLVVISNGSSPTVDEDTAFRHSPMNHHLAEEVRERVPTSRAITLSTAMRPEEMAAAFDAARQADVVVFGLFTRVRSYVEDAIRVPKPFQELIGRTRAEGRPVALLNFGNPYVCGDLPQAALALAAFSDEKDSIDAAVAVLFGERKPGGRLPVRISDRYPFGHGLARRGTEAPAGR